MNINILDISGAIRCTVPVNEGAKGYSELMSHDYIVLPFSSVRPVSFSVGDYADLRGTFDEALGGKLSKIYKFITLQTPTYNTSTGAYDYELRLDAYYYEWNNKLFKYLPEEHGQEASWSLTAPLDIHMGIFLRNLRARGYKYSEVDYEFAIDESVANKSLALTYSDVKLIDALTMMAEAAECEWWITDNIIHFGKCEYGSSVKMELNVEAYDMTRNDSKGTYATRIYAFGGDKNIPSNYRPVDEQTVVSGVVQKRLMLPSSTPYVDAREGMSEADVIEGIVTFDDIFPKRIGTMEDIQTVDRKLETDDDENATFKAYQYKDSGLTFSSKYILEGEELKITFQSGKLNGMTFGVTFNPDGKNPEEQLFEIVANEDYGRLLPDEVLNPRNGDEYVLFGFNIQLVSDQYIPAAEQELLAKAKEYVAKTCIDDGTYTVTLFSKYVQADMMNRTYDIGQKVGLVNPAFFDGTRESRILGWEMNLDFPFDSAVYTIGESAQYSRLGDVESKVEEITYNGQVYGGGSGRGVYVVRLHDNTPPSDSNVLSALRSLATFLRKDKEDSTNYLISFLGGLLSDNIKSSDFAEGVLGSGFSAWVDENGQSHMEVDKLLVRLKAEFESLVIREIKHIGGEFILSNASMTVSKVEYISELGQVTYPDGSTEAVHDAYRCYFTADNGEKAIVNDFAVGDLATCRTWNIKDGVYESISNRYYWRKVVGTGANYIDLSADDCDITGYMPYELSSGALYESLDGIYNVNSEATAGIPQVGDEIVQLGNKVDSDRQSAIVLSTYGDDSPSIKLYKGINSYSLSGKEFLNFSRKEISATVDSIKFTTGENVKDELGSLNNKFGDYTTTENIKASFAMSKGGISLLGKDISLKGMVTFESFDKEAQDKVNKATEDAATAKTDASDAKTKAEESVNGITASKDEMAKDLGYKDFADLKSQAEAGKTLVNGGYIRTSLIDVDSLFVGTINANDATITNFKFANAQSLDGSFSVDGDGVVKIGDFTVSKGALKASSGNISLIMAGQGIKFSSQNLYAGIGNTIASENGYSERIAAFFKVNYEKLPMASGAVMIRTTGSPDGASATFARQVALKIETEGGEYDTAIDFKGRLRSNGQYGMTFNGASLGNGYAMNIVNGLIVSIYQT